VAPRRAGLAGGLRRRRRNQRAAAGVSRFTAATNGLTLDGVEEPGFIRTSRPVVSPYTCELASSSSVSTAPWGCKRHAFAPGAAAADERGILSGRDFARLSGET